jgi:type IV secretory pathway TraG/TraD family ATPase VirD4
VLVTGLTGSGKTAGITMPVLIEAARYAVSVVAFDLKHGERDSLARAVSAWQRRGRDVWTFAPLERGSLRWNPLAGCRSIGAAMRIAAMLFDEADAGDPDAAFWVGAERHVFATLALAVATDGGEGTFGRVRALCTEGPEAVRGYLRGHPEADVLDRHLGAYRAMLPKDEAGILLGIATRLDAWTDDAVCQSTGDGHPDERIDLDRLRREPVLLLIGIPQGSLARLRAVWQLFHKDLTSRLLRPRERTESIPVLQVVEELPAWGALPGLADQLATLRSRQVSVLATIQSEAQGEMVYGRAGWAAVAANLVTKAYVAPLADLDAERLSRALGTTFAHDVSSTRSWGERGAHGAEHYRDIAVPLRRPEQLQGVDTEDDEILLRCPRQPPARLWSPPYYLRPEYRGLVPERPPTAREVAVCHRLWMKRDRCPDPTCPDVRAGRSSVSVAEPTPSLRTQRIRETPRDAQADQRGGASTDAAVQEARARVTRRPALGAGNPDASAWEHGASPEDLAGLRHVVESLLSRACNNATSPVRLVVRSGRLIEIRVDPATVVTICGGQEAMRVLIRRWVELRWVRRVRPMMVLERRAIEAATSPQKVATPAHRPGSYVEPPDP